MIGAGMTGLGGFDAGVRLHRSERAGRTMLTNYNLYAAMRRAADFQINDALRGRTSQWPRLPYNEPSAVQAVTLGGVSQVAEAWKNLLRPIGLVVTTHAVFCHSSPQVDFRYTGSVKPPVELADLLIVVDVAQPGGAYRHARLIQAKVAKPGGHISLRPGKEQVQLALMSFWPTFWFTAKAYSRTHWNLRDRRCPGGHHQSGRYGAIHSNLTSWRQVVPGTVMSMVGFPSLGVEITNMVFGSAGRPARIGGGDPWSDLIEELMSITYFAVYGKSQPHRRGQSSSSQFLTQAFGTRTGGATALAWESIPEGPPGEHTVDMPEGPISFIHLTISPADEAPLLPLG